MNQYENDLDLFAKDFVKREKKEGVRKYSKSKSNWACLPCAESLFDYIPNSDAKFIDGICVVCNNNASVADVKNFGIKLK
jgi:hypothetical protein